MRLKKILSICSVLAVASGMQISANAATQIYTMPDISNINQSSDTTELNEGFNGVTTILNGAETGPWTGVKTGNDSKWRILKQSLKNTSGESDGDGHFASAAGAAFKFDYSGLAKSGITNKDIIYYTFNFMGAAASGNGGNYAINDQRFDKNGIGLFDSETHKIYQHHPERMTVIVDNLNHKTYYYSTTNRVSKDPVSGYETAIMLGTRTDSSDRTRTFFNDFTSGKIEYEVTGADTVTAGGSAEYKIAEKGDAGLYYYTFTPENVTYTLASEMEGVKIDNGKLTVDDTVDDNTTVTINANINGTTVASKEVKVNKSSVSEQNVTSEKLESTIDGGDGSKADVFYCTYTGNEEDSVSKIKVTVSDQVKELPIANLTGSGTAYFAVVISYSGGENKNYTPTFNFE